MCTSAKGCQGSWLADGSFLQKLVLEKGGAPGSDPGRHKQTNNSASLGLAVAHSGLSKPKRSGLSQLFSRSATDAPHYTCCSCVAGMENGFSCKLVNNRGLIFHRNRNRPESWQKFVWGHLWHCLTITWLTFSGIINFGGRHLCFSYMRFTMLITSHPAFSRLSNKFSKLLQLTLSGLSL